jgi:hypothetical protein
VGAILLVLSLVLVLKSVAGEADSLKKLNAPPYPLSLYGSPYNHATSMLVTGYHDESSRFAIPLALGPVLAPSSPPEYSFVRPARLAIVTGVAVSAMADAYIYMKNAWWRDQTRSFHFNPKNDYLYALNIDKLGHFCASGVLSDGFASSLRWAGIDCTKSLIYGAALASFVEIVQEVVDGFAPGWGFSLGDAGSDIVGSLYPVAQSWIPFLENFTFKWSYWPTKDSNPRRAAAAQNQGFVFLDDYEGQTYWLSLNVRNFLPKDAKPYWPSFLNIAAGFSVENRNLVGAGNWIVLLAPDIQLSNLFPVESEFWKSVFHFLDYFHIPTPALRISPSVSWYGLYISSAL